MIGFFLALLSVTLIGLKLADVIAISWLVALLPVLIPLGLWVLVVAVSVLLFLAFGRPTNLRPHI